jgi:nucleoside-diphosphate-sugar epimerase
MPTLIRHGLKGELPPLVDPKVARDLVYVEDVVEAYLLAARSQKRELGPVYNVGTGVETSVREVVNMARRVLNVAAAPVWNTMPNRLWDSHIWVSDNRKIHAELGWQPRMNVEAGFRLMLDWFHNGSPPGYADQASQASVA